MTNNAASTQPPRELFEFYRSLAPWYDCVPRGQSAFSFHKMLAPFGVGVLYGKEHLLQHVLPFLDGGDMIAEGRVAPNHVDYNALPWKCAAGTPNILGVIASAEALRLVLELVAGRRRWFGTAEPLPRPVVESSMNLIAAHIGAVTEQAMHAAYEIAGLSVYGPPPGTPRPPLLAFNLRGVGSRERGRTCTVPTAAAFQSTAITILPKCLPCSR